MRLFSATHGVLSSWPSHDGTAAERRPPASAGPQDPLSHARHTVAIVVAAFFALLAVSLLGHRGDVQKVEQMPVAFRTVEYARTLADVEASCTGAEAKAGPMREHCLHQAQFLMLFPECDARCRAVVGVVMPHAHR